MYVDFRMLNSCGSLYKRHDLFLNIVRNLYDVAAVEDVDNHINDDLFIYKLDLYALVSVLQANKLRKFSPGSIRQSGYTLYFSYSGFDNAANAFFADVYAAFFGLPAAIILALRYTSKLK